MTILHRSFPLLLAVVLNHHAPAQSQWPTNRWPTVSPSAVGLDEKALAALDSEILGGKYGYIDGMLVIRNGKVAYDKAYKFDYDSIYSKEAKVRSALNAHDPSGPYNYFNPWWHPFYRRGNLHTLQSVTKTITSVVIGVATKRKDFPSLDTPILSFFDTTKVANIDDRKRRIKIRHLLTMSDGFDWNENLPYNDPNNHAVQMEASFDWVQLAIDRPMANEPGRVFNYNSGATQLLSHIFRAATGKDVEEYASKHLFAPLGIHQFYWKRTSTGLPDTEGGLFLEPRDLAKIWYLFLRNGKWDGSDILEPEWVKASITPSMTVSPDGTKYGLKWWLVPYSSDSSRFAWAGSGFGGQYPVAFQEYDLIMVFTGWNILPEGSRLSRKIAIEQILSAVMGRPSSDKKK